ncbi:MAG TPA: adenylate kinase [Blastocatellia bacterium]|nr:adenylate kinase [Blastocatellia bacterium]
MTDSSDREAVACVGDAATNTDMPDIIVLMGPQGAGKGTQAHLLAEILKLPLVATGDILREMAHSDEPLGLQVRKVQAAGQLVSDDILAEVVKTRLSRKDCEGGCVLDGFPRTLPQTRLLETIAEHLGHRITVISIVVPRELLFKRLAGRRTCTLCNEIYNVNLKPSKIDGVCDLDGQPLFTRSDDNEEAIAQRLALYDEKTRPLLDHYEESGRLYKIDGTGAPEDVFERIGSILGKQRARDAS